MEKFGLKYKDIEKINHVFEQYPAVEKVILYGSRAKGNYKNGSDIDLTIVDKNFGFNELLNLETRLDDLLLPYKIDLSILTKISNTELVSHIERVGKVFYKKPII